MTESKEKIIRRIQKLTAKADSTIFESEAAICMRLARNLLAEYQLSMIDVQSKETGDPEFKTWDGAVGNWQGFLAYVVAEYCGCKSFYVSGGRGHKRQIRFIGMPHELEIAFYTFDIMARQIKSMLTKRRAELRNERQNSGLRRQNRRDSSMYTTGYAMGVIDFLKEDLLTKKKEEQAAAEAGDTTALVLVTPSAVTEWCDKNLSQGRGRRMSMHDHARVRGYKDGHQVKHRSGVSGPASRKQIGN